MIKGEWNLILCFAVGEDRAADIQMRLQLNLHDLEWTPRREFLASFNQNNYAS